MRSSAEYSGGGGYRAYRPRPFTKEERQTATILFGGLHWRAERVLEGVFENCGYRARRLPPASHGDLMKGKELADIGQCCPTTFNTGCLANFLLAESDRVGPDAVSESYVYVTAGSCGACRFGQYHQSYELALKNLDLQDFRIFLVSQDRLDQGAVAGGGLEIDFRLLSGAAFAVLCTDVIRDMEYQVRPYEIEPGATDKAVSAAIEELYQALRTRPALKGSAANLIWHATTDYFARCLRRIRRHFDPIRVDRLQVKPKVKITGEFYLHSVEGAANHNIHHWLEAEGAEVYPAAIAIWLDYLIRFAAQDFADRRGFVRFAGLKSQGLRLGSRFFRSLYRRLRSALLEVPHDLPDQWELQRLAAPYYDARLSGGEGDMLIGKAIWAHLQKKAHMICELSPYGCMPNTMSVGAMAAVLGQHPDLLYAPIEIKGDSEIHALSRCQMILAEAKQRAQTEFQAALRKTGLTRPDAARLIRDQEEMSHALYRVPDHGAVGTAANIVLELGRRN